MAQGSFFDFREQFAKAGQKKRAQADESQAITVTQLTGKIESALRTGVPGSLTVRGEVSNFNHHRASGHFYFTLKDPTACIDCVMFKGEAAKLKFTPIDGLEILATGSVRVYAQRGRYQLYITTMSPLGQGALELAFKQLQEKLAKEGLFDSENKQPIPTYPTTVALVTGRETAALQDMLKVLKRFPFVHVKILPVLVQGDGAAGQISAALAALSRAEAADVIILARGGGSLEDLWAFNEETVARAVAACNIPIITGIGHEVDVSIADLVADYHAHTPTEAAQVAMANWRNAGDAVDALSNRLRRALLQQLVEARQRLRTLTQHELFRRPGDLVDERRQWVDDRQRSLVSALTRRASLARESLHQLTAQFAQHHPRHRVAMARQQLGQSHLQIGRLMRVKLETLHQRLIAAGAQLRSISPQSTLSRGYSITTRKTGEILRAAADVKPGDVLLTRFADGEAESVVRDRKQLRIFEE